MSLMGLRPFTLRCCFVAGYQEYYPINRLQYLLAAPPGGCLDKTVNFTGEFLADILLPGEEDLRVRRCLCAFLGSEGLLVEFFPRPDAGVDYLDILVGL